MSTSTKELIIFGNTAFAEIAYEYFTHDSDFTVVAFCVDRSYINDTEKFGLPVVAYDELEDHYLPSNTHFYVAMTYGNVNELRTKYYLQLKEQGYMPASYISSRAFIWKNVEIGEHCFIFEDNTVQPFVKVGNNVIMWSGNHIGHHSVIKDNCFISSHAVISGYCTIGESSFIGVNSTFSNNIEIGHQNWVGLGAVIVRNTGDSVFFKAPKSEKSPLSVRKVFKLDE